MHFEFVINAIIAVAFVFVSLYFLKYFKKIEERKCACSQSWKNGFIKFCLWAVIVGQVMAVSRPLLINTAFASIVTLATMIVSVMSLLMIIVTRMFISDIKADSCTCAKTDEFHILNIFNMVQIFLLVIAFTAIMFSVYQLAKFTHIKAR
jgi:hypothetical protein